MKSFPIDFVRQVIEQTMLEEHLKDSTYFGGKDQVNLFSFYEQLQKEDEVDRYVEMYRDLSQQQNRTGLIMNGTIIAPENPTITNLQNCLIIPMAFTCSFRVLLANRDRALDTINHLIEKLKGRKQDIASFESTGELFKVGTLGNYLYYGASPAISSGDFIGAFDPDDTINTYLNTEIGKLIAKGLVSTLQIGDYLYYEDLNDGHIGAFRITQVSPSYTGEIVLVDNEYGIPLPLTQDSYIQYKLSMSFDSIRCDEPYNLNEKEYCTISFGGSATLVSSGVALGNELVQVGIKRLKIVAQTDINISENYNWLEPLELPSGNNADTMTNQLLSNKFLSNSHTNGLALSLQYTFIADMNKSFIKELFRYARYGTQADGSTIAYTSGFTPNMILEVKEIWSSWGIVEPIVFKAKMIESIDIENTESDTLTITLPLQIQGDNN